MSAVATIMSKESIEYCRYSVVKIDSEVLPLVRAAASLEHKTLQEWLSDLANDAAARRTHEKPIKRKPPKPRAPRD
jgi:hypothetical protein